MRILLGSTGHVGPAVAAALLHQGEAVSIITRNHGVAVTPAGATVAVAHVHAMRCARSVLAR